ncbi:unnamed protein product [Scytosiphon promiscuus]
MSGDQGTRMARKWELGLVTEAQMREESNEVAPPFYSYRLFRSACGEFIGSMLFLFMVITVARFSGNRPDDELSSEVAATTMMIAAAFGLSIFVLVYILAENSGAHLNPAVSIGLLVGKRISVERFFIYVVAQLAGATAGAGIATVFLNSTSGGANAIADGILAKNAFGGEVLCTFLLLVTIFAACDGELGRKNGHIGALLPLVIGGAVLLSHLVLIPIDGCSINPARSFATAVTNGEWDDHWVFWAGPMVGGVLATFVWEAVLRPDQAVQDDEEKTIAMAATA